MLGLGERIPEMTVKAFHDGQIREVSLRDYAGGWLVVMFYPEDFTTVCPTELEAMARQYKSVKKAGAEVLSVSTDTAERHKKWHDESPAVGRVKFPMLADPDGEVCRAFGTYDDGAGRSKRATFILDPQGMVRSLDMHDSNIGRSAKETLRRLQALKHVFENPGEACPDGWMPGDPALKMSLGVRGMY